MTFAVKDVNAMSSHSEPYGICIDVASCCSAGQFSRLSPTFLTEPVVADFLTEPSFI